jgi:hypothetical protein
MMRSWRDLCEEAQAEVNPKNFQKLAKQITRILGDRLAFLRASQSGRKSLKYTPARRIAL